MARIGIIDLKVNNVKSLSEACREANIDTFIFQDKSNIEEMDGIIIPGVGSFPIYMKKLKSLGLDRVINSFYKNNKPILGICLGMQLLFNQSDEFGITKGLSFLNANVTKLSNKSLNSIIPVPHIGWNKIFKTNKKSSLLKNIDNHIFFYFVHSYFIEYTYKDDFVSSNCFYGLNKIISSVEFNNLYGLQFHPENSGEKGIEILKNFGDICNV
jgi:imidazole glycerol-phosphate synthase subunit HisH